MILSFWIIRVVQFYDEEMGKGSKKEEKFDVVGYEKLGWKVVF